MTDTQQIETELEQLRAIKKPTPGNKARIKALESKLKKAQQQANPAARQENVFGIVATTKISPLPIRFTQNERAHLSTLRDDMRVRCPEQIVSELGRLEEINETKLIRAAVLLLKERTDEEIIAAIKQVKLNMLR